MGDAMNRVRVCSKCFGVEIGDPVQSELDLSGKVAFENQFARWTRRFEATLLCPSAWSGLPFIIVSQTQPVKLGVPAFHLACGKREFGEFICPCHVVNGWQSTPE